MSTRFRLSLTLLVLALLGPARAAVQVSVGPTPIPGGNARARGDITVVNEHLAFSLSVESAAPYGVPRGALVDIAPVSEGRIGHDRVVFADFIPNNWSAWPNTYQRVEILEKGPQRVRIRSVRDFGKVRLETLYTLREQSDRIELTARMSNEGDAPIRGLLSGFTLWPSSGFFFPVPGLAGVNEGDAHDALAKRVSAYDADWAVTLHAPYLERVGSRSRDLFLQHTLAPGATRTFDATLQVTASGDLAPALRAESEGAGLPTGKLHGEVTDRAGEALSSPVVVIEKNDQPYAWTLGHAGHYEFDVAPGQYTLYATAANYSRSAAAPVTVRGGAEQSVDFRGLEPPGEIHFSVREARSAAPLDARIAILSGNPPPVEFLGRKTFFTELRARGTARVPIAPGNYGFSVSAGAGVLGRDVQVAVSVPSGRSVPVRVRVQRLFNPPARGWYSADLHHHADQAEAVTPPEDLARSQLAAGLDLLFVSDHDATVNHDTLRRIAAERGVAFIPGIELSPSWGHFNAYPLDAGAQLAIDTSTATVSEVLREARREGASIVQVNHPFIPYGYLSSVAAGVAPGGFAGDFDLLEINSSEPQDDAKVLERAWSYWNAGQHYYLSGGSDTHDVWNEQSGRVRTFAHLAGAPSAAAFAAALKAGHAYVTYGPLIYPQVMFGNTLTLPAGRAFTLGFELGAAAGLKQAELIGNGARVQQRHFAAGTTQAHSQFALRAERAGWYALTVEDQAGRKAYSDPIWITLSPQPPVQR